MAKWLDPLENFDLLYQGSEPSNTKIKFISVLKGSELYIRAVLCFYKQQLINSLIKFNHSDIENSYQK